MQSSRTWVAGSVAVQVQANRKGERLLASSGSRLLLPLKVRLWVSCSGGSSSSARATQGLATGKFAAASALESAGKYRAEGTAAATHQHVATGACHDSHDARGLSGEGDAGGGGAGTLQGGAEGERQHVSARHAGDGALHQRGHACSF